MLLGVCACAPAADANGGAGGAGGDAADCADRFDGSPLGVACGALVDAEGRTVLLHGVNARVEGVFDDALPDGTLTIGAIPAFGADDAAAMRAMGFDALRLPIHWSLLEPTETGGFDDGYLDAVARVVDVCGAAGVLVVVDVHQDGYTKFIGDDGAPLWATIPAPPPRDATDPNRDISTAAMDAFDTLLGSAPGSPALQARFAAMLSHVAARFAGDAAVVGFEVLNEPLAEQADLDRFHRTMIAAAHGAAPKKLVFFEPSATRNVLDTGPLGSGSLGAGSVYAPHVYTRVFVGGDAGITKELLTNSNVSARQEAESYDAPLAITEYGFSPSDPLFADYIRWQEQLQEEQLASSFFWVWKEESLGSWGFYDFDEATGAATQRPAIVSEVARVRLEAAPGKLTAAAYDDASRTFEARYDGSATITADAIVSIGATANFMMYDATCDGAPIAHDGADPVHLACAGPGSHTLRLVAR
jgi:endoglycosylceramidase